MKRKLLGLITLIFTLPCFAQTSHIEYNKNCMDRYIYQIEDSENGKDFVSYRMQMGANQYTILEVGAENGKWTQSRPSGTISCQSYPINRRKVQEINEGKRKLYVVRKSREGYQKTLVTKATYYYMVGSELDFTSKDADFSFNLTTPVYNKNLASSQSPKKVFLDGVDFAQCEKGFILRKTDDLRDKDYKEFTFNPEVGVLEKRSVILGRNKTKVIVMRLQTINGKSVNEVISARCSQQQAESYDKPTPVVTSYSAGSYNKRINTKPTPTFVSRGAPCPNNNREGWHVVKAGETLYSIARRYGISLAQLRDWNGLQNSNAINPCEELKVTTYTNTTTVVNTRPAVVTTAPPAVTTTPVVRNEIPTYPSTSTTTNTYTGYQPNTIVNTRPSTTTTRPRPTYDKTYATGGTPAWVNSESYHVVQTGETVASIATNYGFTEARFRYMNGLGEREYLYSGQTMRVTICEENKNLSNTGQPHPYNNTTTAIIPNSYNTTTAAIAPNSRGIYSFSNYNETYIAPRSGGVNYRVHIVQNGESLFSIARDYGTTTERLAQINNLSPGEVIMQSQRVYVDK